MKPVHVSFSVQNASKANKLRLAALEQQKSKENVNKIMERQQVIPCFLYYVFVCCFLFNDSWLWMFAMRKYQREKETVLGNLMRLSIQSEEKHNLELGIKHLMQKLQVMVLKPGDEDSELGKGIDELNEELNEKITELNDVESFNQTLIAKESKNSDELREAREVLIDVRYLLHHTTQFHCMHLLFMRTHVWPNCRFCRVCLGRGIPRRR